MNNKYSHCIAQNDGMLLWNNTADEWATILQVYFSIASYEGIYYAEHD
ncbi:MAG: hypothetical protein GX096_02555 [Clostridiales bacterium]|nr:hypothetical protein [Clostridiales bacterium]